MVLTQTVDRLVLQKLTSAFVRSRVLTEQQSHEKQFQGRESKDLIIRSPTPKGTLIRINTDWNHLQIHITLHLIFRLSANRTVRFDAMDNALFICVTFRLIGGSHYCGPAVLVETRLSEGTFSPSR